MKRFWSTSEYVRQQRLRRRDGDRRTRKSRGNRRRRRSPRIRPHLARRDDGRVEIVAPEAFSLFDNSDATTEFFDDYRASLNRRNTRVYLNLGGARRASSDVLLLTRAIMDLGRAKSSYTSGNLPSDPAVAAKVKQSGFFEGFARPPGPLPPPKGIMRRKTSTRVESEVAAELVSFAMEHASMSKPIADACNKTLVELMLNTRNHATQVGDPARGRERPTAWRASVYCEDDVAHFTFLDVGVGILRSFAPRRFLRLAGLTLTAYGEVNLLREVFKGHVGASADKPGRGYGLTQMRATAETFPILNLQVLTAGVVGEIANLTFRRMKTRFQGTIFRWRTGPRPDAS